jgi:hypothetical protein
MNTLTSRRRSVGLAAGALWLIVISFVFIIWSLVAIGTPMSKNILIGMLILLCILIAICVIVLRAALVLPQDIEQRSKEEQKIGRRFAFIVGAEVLAFAVVNTFAGITRNFELMPSLNLIIVGIHFFPLAKIFRVQRYFYTGLFFCAIPVATLLAIPKQFAIGQTLAWYIVPSLGCGLVASLTAVEGLREAWRTIYKIRDTL